MARRPPWRPPPAGGLTNAPRREMGPGVPHPPPVDLGAVLPAWSALPFAGMLLSIALLPLLAPDLWNHHFGKVTAAWSLLMAVPFVVAYGDAAVDALLHVALLDYVPFLILLATLFTIGGGIHVGGRLRGSPPVNAAIMA